MNHLRYLLSKALFTSAILVLLHSTALAASVADRLSTFTEKGMQLWQVPGMAVTVVSSDETRFQKGFGETATEAGTPVDEHTLFAIASTTKAMVVSGILMLVDEGKLSLDDPIIKHVPELHFEDPMLTEVLTVRDLLTHRTGLPSTDFWTFMQDMSLEEQIKRLRDVSATAQLRTRHIYQNTMFELAGLLIERLGGMTWDQFLTERLWLPIGMTETFGALGQMRPGMASVSPYFLVDGKLTPADWDFPADLTNAAGSAWSSIHDMGLWAQFLLREGVTSDEKRLVSEALFEEMFTPQSLIAEADFYPTTELTNPNWLSYGLGWFQQDFQGRKIDFHTGSLSGLIAIIGLDRAADKAVVVLGNRDHAEMRHAVLWEVMDNRPADSRRDWNQDIFELYETQAEESDEKWIEASKSRLKKTRPALPLDQYAGVYESTAMGTVRIQVEGHDLLLQFAQIEMPMTHWHLDTFLVEHDPWEIREFADFRIAPDGKIKAIEVFGERFVPVAEDK